MRRKIVTIGHNINHGLSLMLRRLIAQDLPELTRIEASCQVTPWSEELFKRCLDAGSTGWMIELEGQMIGFILILFQADEVHILNFGVDPKHQRQGFGKQLLIHTLQDIRKQGATFVYLEVRRSNHGAITLYEKVGFNKVGERKDYYALLDQREDALVFAKHLLAE